MDQTPIVGVDEPVGGIQGDKEALRRGQEMAPLLQIGHRAAEEQLGHQVGVGVLTPVLDGDQVRVVQIGHGRDPAQQPVPKVLIARHRLDQTGHGDVAVAAPILGQVDLERGPGPDQGAQSVAAGDETAGGRPAIGRDGGGGRR